VTLLARHVFQNSPQFTVPGVEVWTPRGPILGADKRPERSSAATSKVVLTFGQELSHARRPIPDH
jgi:hypothetical protein